jgi:hypothetical protein
LQKKLEIENILNCCSHYVLGNAMMQKNEIAIATNIIKTDAANCKIKE